MKKIVILGATGMAGHMIYQYLADSNEYELIDVCFRTKLTDNSSIVDVRDERAIEDLLKEIRPDVVINCIGVLIKGCNVSIENGIFLNAYLPHMLSRITHSISPSSRIIHISTDCVFSGKRGHYLDSDFADASDPYGVTKKLGELNNDRDLTLRTSIIGPELKKNGEGLFHWVFGQLKNKEVKGYRKSIWSGITTLELAKIIREILYTNLTGIYQLSNNNPISKCELISMIVDEFQLPINIIQTDGPSLDKSIINSRYSNYSHDIPGYGKMLKELHEFMSDHKHLYMQYWEKI